MPTPRLTPAQMQEAVDLWQNHDRSIVKATAAAEAQGINGHTYQSRLERAKKEGYHLSEGARDSMTRGGLAGLEVRGGHRRVYDDDGKQIDTIRYSVPQESVADAEDALVERIVGRINRVVAAPAISRPRAPRSDIQNFMPWFDLHLGMRVGSYGTAQAVARLQDGARDVMDRAPLAETLIIVNGGDFTEANDNSALTPHHKHPLAVDMDFDDISDIAVDTTISLIEHALTRADRVIYQPLKANHDPHMAIILRQALRQRYRENKRFELRDGFTMFAHEWSGNFIAAIHGDQKISKPGELTLAIAARHAAAWGNSRHRELWRGHRHKELTVAVPGMTVYQVNPICPHGRYANDNLFTGQSDIQCVTYGAGGGRKASTVHIYSD